MASQTMTMEDILEDIDATPSEKKVLTTIIDLKDSPEPLFPGKLSITYRDLAEKAEVALGTVTRAFQTWQHLGIISIIQGANRSQPNTIIFHGFSNKDADSPLQLIEEELQTLKMAIQQMNEAVEAIETKLDAYGLESKASKSQSKIDIIEKFVGVQPTEIDHHTVIARSKQEPLKDLPEK